jgi:ech hydrogenase subunit F
MPYFIMAGKTMKNLFSKPATRLYPIQKRQSFPVSRGHITINVGTCIFCGICQKKCPADAISVARKEKTWEIQRLKCVACGCCVDVCPKDCLSMDNIYSTPVTGTDRDSARNLFRGASIEQPGQPEKKDA